MQLHSKPYVRHYDRHGNLINELPYYVYPHQRFFKNRKRVLSWQRGQKIPIFTDLKGNEVPLKLVAAVWLSPRDADAFSTYGILPSSFPYKYKGTRLIIHEKRNK